MPPREEETDTIYEYLVSEGEGGGECRGIYSLLLENLQHVRCKAHD